MKTTSRFRFLPVTILITTFALLLGGCAKKPTLAPLMPAPPPLESAKGMVVAAQPLAAQAGISVLEEGGNAVDAALAALFMLNVVEPHASGLGGGGFALVKMADEDPALVMFRERAPKAIDTAFYHNPLDTLHLRKNQNGSSICVPGAAAGWADLFDRWATLPLERLAQDGINAAEGGFPIDPTLAAQIGGNLEKIMADSNLIRTFLKDGILPYEAGDTLRQPELAATFRTLVERGLHSFYRGPIAEAVAQASQKDGGMMTDDDLAFFRAETVAPLKVELGKYQIITIPSPSQGGLAFIESMRLFDAVGACNYPQGSRESVHLMAQCIQQAYADADARVDDAAPEAAWRDMLTPEHLAAAAQGISLEAEAGSRAPYLPDLSKPGNTTHLVVVDGDGNCVSLTQSINWFFGSGRMAEGTGIILNNQMADFSLPPDSVNLIAPRKRPRSNMTPVIILRSGQPYLVLGTPGGARIPSSMAQITAGIIHYGQEISSAIDYPRFFPAQNHLVMENRQTLPNLKRLKKDGWIIHLAGPYHNYFGGAHGILVDDGRLFGAADRRRGGAAIGR